MLSQGITIGFCYQAQYFLYLPCMIAECLTNGWLSQDPASTAFYSLLSLGTQHYRRGELNPLKVGTCRNCQFEAIVVITAVSVLPSGIRTFLSMSLLHFLG